MSSVLTSADIQILLNGTPPLIESAPHIHEQIQPNGFDLTVKAIASFASSGRIGFRNETRVLSDSSPLQFDNSETIDLAAGCYLITHNEILHLPNNIMALSWPRSSLLRCGVSVHNAVWDAGYSGRSQSLLAVYNAKGFRLYKNARIIQLVFFPLTQEVKQGYNGIFQGENI